MLGLYQLGMQTYHIYHIQVPILINSNVTFRYCEKDQIVLRGGMILSISKNWSSIYWEKKFQCWNLNHKLLPYLHKLCLVSSMTDKFIKSIGGSTHPSTRNPPNILHQNNYSSMNHKIASHTVNFHKETLILAIIISVPLMQH